MVGKTEAEIKRLKDERHKCLASVIHDLGSLRREDLCSIEQMIPVPTDKRISSSVLPKIANAGAKSFGFFAIVGKWFHF